MSSEETPWNRTFEVLGRRFACKPLMWHLGQIQARALSKWSRRVARRSGSPESSFEREKFAASAMAAMDAAFSVPGRRLFSWAPPCKQGERGMPPSR
ncbi:MAG: hypothetical protein RIS92_1366 [Verrucomicrobiota bacterium]